tara:strand:+ start:665 stop:1447 length:783 start_codon:yes stop_codon:yes gene_type:complete
MNKLLTLDGQIGVVGGAGSGIGRASAEALASRGARLILLGRRMSALEEVREGLPGDGHQAIACDFSDTGQLRTISMELSQAENITIVVHNTGGPPSGPLHEAGINAIELAIRQHVISAQIFLQSFLPTMRNHGTGRFITITSSSVVTPIKNLGVSNVVRAAMHNWVRTMAGELAQEKITVNNILPGYVDTDRLKSLFSKKAEKQNTSLEEIREETIKSLPINRLAMPEELGNAVAFLASPEASYITGIALPVDGGRLALR